ncbi:MAG: hypothetical protein AAFY67_17975 [Cyanobacteria bacterium J06642_9]
MNIKLLANKATNKPKRIFRKAKRLLEYSAEDTYRVIAKQSSWSSVINQKELRILGLRRSGNHAIAEWIKAQENGSVEQLNNLEVRCNPYRHKYHRILDFYPEHTNWAIKHYMPLARGNFVELDCLMLGYEDHALTSITDPLFERMHDVYLGKSNQRFDIIIMRDPFNLFASRLKSGMIDVKSGKSTAVELWIQYAREFLNETNYLKHNKICLNYNHWFTDLEYRKALADQIGNEFTDAGMDRVAHLGGGSSFDGQNMDGAGRKMAVNDRWKQFVDHPDYRKIFQNQQLLDYSKKIFGDIPGTEVLL